MERKTESNKLRSEKSMWIVAFIRGGGVDLRLANERIKDAREAIAAAGGNQFQISVHGFFQRAENRLYRPVDSGCTFRNLRIYHS